MNQKFTEKQIKKVWSFIESGAPMTQNIYNAIMDGTMGLGDEVEPLIERLMAEYPGFTKVYADAIKKEVEAAELPPMPAETKVRIKKNLDEWIKTIKG